LGDWNWYAPHWLLRFLPRHALTLEGTLDHDMASVPVSARDKEPVSPR